MVRGGERPGPDTGRTGAMLALLACFEGNRTAVSTGKASSRAGSFGKLGDMSPSGLHIVVSKGSRAAGSGRARGLVTHL